jgi:predicted ATPase
VSVTGPGGVGKTRLALRVAADLVSELGDGVVSVDQSPVHDPAQVEAAVARALGVRAVSRRPLREIVPATLPVSSPAAAPASTS